MEIYTRKTRWKTGLIIAGVLILLVTLVYANFLANKLRVSEKKNAEIFALATEELFKNQESTQDLTLADSIRSSYSLPIIVESETGELLGNNFGAEQNIDQDFLKSKVLDFKKTGQDPIEGFGYASRIYPFNSSLLTYIKFFPLVQALLVLLFISIGYYLFSISRRAEQNRVWAGMAKETAHQLGTPISAILAWIEHLKITAEDNPEQQEILQELIKDVDRLELVADRFSKIGSAPKLVEVDLYEQLIGILKYMHRRASRKIHFNYPSAIELAPVAINKHLFDWVIENLIRNSLDAMDAKGSISVQLKDEINYVCVEITDSGKGIAPGKLKTVFNPGFTTKKRGWGLGLSLAKRIIEEYHKGKIFVKSSKVGEGTTFAIKFPKSTIDITSNNS